MALGTRLLTRRVLNRCDRAVFISRTVLDFFAPRCRFAQPPVFLPNGVDGRLFPPADPARRRRLRRALGLTDGRPAVLFVGRFVEKKGLPLLREAAARLPDCDWLFAGSGP